MSGKDILIQVKNLEKHFDGGSIRALNGVSADIRRGEVVVVIGPSGSGKSTFLRCLNLLERPTEGAVIFDGVDITDPKVNIDLHRQKMGMVFQHFNLFPHMTILKNMTLAPVKLLKKSREEAEAKALTLLDRVGLKDRAAAYPSQLSGGQKQRVAIARALATSPKLLLCDEPTSALDSLTTRSILELLSDINHRLGVTIIIITHEIAVVRKICNKVAVLEGGVLVDNGPIGEVLDSDMHPITRSLFFGRED